MNPLQFDFICAKILIDKYGVAAVIAKGNIRLTFCGMPVAHLSFPRCQPQAQAYQNGLVFISQEGKTMPFKNDFDIERSAEPPDEPEMIDGYEIEKEKLFKAIPTP